MIPMSPERGGILRNGNPQGNPNAAPRCGARNRRGTPCQGPAMRHKRRCRLHGGKSTGPRTPEGLKRSQMARYVHGGRSRELRELMRANRAAIRELDALFAQLDDL